MRTGLVAKKVGMSRYYTEDGRHLPVTLLKLDNCQVTAVRTEEKDGYNAVQLGVGSRKPKNVSKPLKAQFAKAKVEPKAKVVEFRVSKDALVDVGAEIAADHFVNGQKVDVSGISIGKGFAGAMKRHNFGGLEATHGISISHRSHGSTGQCQDPGRVFKGKKMAGQMGNVKVTTQNLEIVETDPENGIIVVKGAIPGSKGGWVTITDAVKLPSKEELPFPAKLKESGKPAAAKEEAKPEGEAEAAPAEEVTQAPAEEAKAEAPKAEAKSDDADSAKE